MTKPNDRTAPPELTPENIEGIARALGGPQFEEHGWSCRHQALDAILELYRMQHELHLAALGFDPRAPKKREQAR